ncbi:MAG: flagellar basal body P-ring protein FlgI [Proteobacteria bacterium]|nr:flagellar basal body P-ring protein FlgI [Pseudomonadota bacterium]
MCRALLVGVAACATLSATTVRAARIKDIATIEGVRENQIIGYGLVVGLNGTGDKAGTEFTNQSLRSLLSKMGIGLGDEEIRIRNVAAVMVTATLPPFARTGGRIDVLVSSLGDSSSLEGGTLLMTPLFGSDGVVYAIAQGPISVGGFSAGGGGGGSSVQKNHPTVGRLANGAIVERELKFDLAARESFQMALGSPDFTTAQRTVQVVNARFGGGVAEALDSGTLRLRIPDQFGARPVLFLAELENLEVTPDMAAKVVLNERTGTIVMGADVRIAKVAVSHGSLSVTISATNQVSQPGPFSSGETVTVQNQDIAAFEEEANLIVVEGPVTIGELVQGLNAMGVTPRDLIAILQAIKAAGALSADLEVM